MKIKERLILALLTTTVLIQLALMTRGEDSVTLAGGRTTARKVVSDTTGLETNGLRPDRSTVTPEALSSFFQTTLPVTAPVPVMTTPISVSAPPETFFRLGVINDSNGIKRLYVKQRENGRVYKARLDGVAEKGVRYFLNDDRSECIEINGVSHTLQKDTQ